MSDNNCKKMLENYNNIALTWLITAAKNEVIDLSNTNKISGNFNPNIQEKIEEFNKLVYGNSKLDLNIEGLAPYKIMLLKNKKEINFGIFNNIESMNESTIKKIAKELKNCKNIWNLVCVPGIKSQILSNLCEAGKNNKPTYNDSSSSTMARLASATSSKLGTAVSSLGSRLGTAKRSLDSRLGTAKHSLGSKLGTVKRAFSRISKKSKSQNRNANDSEAIELHQTLGGKKSRKKRKKLKRKKSKKYKNLY
jgi:hypothetical protein